MDLGEFRAGEYFEFSLDPTTDFIDAEGNLPVIMCTMHTSLQTNDDGEVEWLLRTTDTTTGKITFSGTCMNNAELPGSILFLCSVTD